MPKIKLPRNVRDLVKRANAGSGDAAWDLSLHYRRGTGGVEKNDELARHWLERGAELGNFHAQCDLGGIHYDAGEYEVAREWFEKSAAQGHPIAEANLGVYYEKGHGVERNIPKAVEFLLRAAKKGCGDAQNNYGLLLSKEMHEHEEAMKWLEKSAAQGYAEAMCNIGTLYHDGKGVPRNLLKAREWWKKAAERGHEGAKKYFRQREFNLEYALKKSGLTMSDDAVHTYLASVPDDVTADDNEHDLALCFLHGSRGVERNLRLAKDWFKLVVERDPDDAAAAEELEKLRACVACGKARAYETCKLCRSVR